MEWLAAHDYTTISPDQLLDGLNGRTTLGPRSVVLTFDDGYLSLYQFARPLLTRLGFVATLFLTTNPVGLASYDKESSFKAAGYPTYDRPLNWAELAEMAEAGWSIESHSCSHPFLSKLDPDRLLDELAKSRQQIEQHLSNPVHFLAYPYGDYSQRVLAGVKKAGYKAAFTVHDGKVSGEDRFRLRRIEINNGDQLADFCNKVKTGYSSERQQLRARVRDLAYASPLVKDVLKTLVPTK